MDEMLKTTLRRDAETITASAIRAVLPDAAVQRALKGVRFPGRVILVAAGKAAWQMAHAACAALETPVTQGIVITKYGHARGALPRLRIVEAGHPIPDENSFSATRQAVELVTGLTEHDTILFLLSGGGSALFELPLISGEELQDITAQLMACGADIVEINTVRKRRYHPDGCRLHTNCDGRLRAGGQAALRRREHGRCHRAL